ncbi:DUF397 domain-containing protein [Streptomyces aureocirculatus]|uniref:DUF397 domain-containing protein n=1 Tax=Streptomyces aureocirculatus TaxID=67275 RepID=UPI00099B70E9
MLPQQGFIRSTYCNQSCECVEVATDAPQGAGKVRDSKKPTVVIEFGCVSWNTFLRGFIERDL